MCYCYHVGPWHVLAVITRRPSNERVASVFCRAEVASILSGSLRGVLHCPEKSITPGYLAGRPHLAVDDAVVAAVPLPLRQVASCNCNTLHVLIGDLSHLQQASHQQQPRHC
ncbi:hypothetical protein PVAP13_3NG310100 [Panicum virgatum]|uniref:Uncharacterized protein n=1 Tax=Panicum virgatum TaxID=38727 RepID=A0A8T0UIM4_PANVG|nr:hypothetical protein PVAP13_3NG310100 [Panicum virgatum]KAG2621856.1 hypothetical protein PVAP13_3NG310100 [Panicum virgatum]